MWCFLPSPTLEPYALDGGLHNRGSDGDDAVDIPLEAIQSVLNFASACIARKGLAENDGMPVQLSVDTMKELRRGLSSVQQARQESSRVGSYSYEPDLEKDDNAPFANVAASDEYLKCHLSDIPEGSHVASRATSSEYRQTTHRIVASDQHTSAPPLPPLAPHFFQHACKARVSSRTHNAELWPTILDSLEEELKSYASESRRCSTGHGGVSQEPVDVGTAGSTGPTSQRYPELVPNSAMTATSGMTSEIDNMIHASAATALDMTASKTATLTTAQLPVFSPKTQIDCAVLDILERMVRFSFLLAACTLLVLKANHLWQLDSHLDVLRNRLQLLGREHEETKELCDNG